MHASSSAVMLQYVREGNPSCDFDFVAVKKGYTLETVKCQAQKGTLNL